MRRMLGVGGLAAVVLGPLAAWLGLVRPMAGFVPFALGGVVGLLVALASVVQVARGRGFGAGGLAGVVAAVVVMAAASGGRGAPRINDFTTDLADPPAFAHAATLPGNAGRDLAYPSAFAAQQRACCADLGPTLLPLAPDAAFARVHAVAAGMPAWTVTHADPAAGIVEAVATSRLFRFRDDIAIRVRPDARGSRVDVRSKSRDGQGDLGANAARIRAFAAALAAAR